MPKWERIDSMEAVILIYSSDYNVNTFADEIRTENSVLRLKWLALPANRQWTQDVEVGVVIPKLKITSHYLQYSRIRDNRVIS
jgi:hypothetical protein